MIGKQQKSTPIIICREVPIRLILLGETLRRDPHNLDTSEATKTGPVPTIRAPEAGDDWYRSGRKHSPEPIK